MSVGNNNMEIIRGVKFFPSHFVITLQTERIKFGLDEDHVDVRGFKLVPSLVPKGDDKKPIYDWKTLSNMLMNTKFDTSMNLREPGEYKIEVEPGIIRLARQRITPRRETWKLKFGTETKLDNCKRYLKDVEFDEDKVRIILTGNPECVIEVKADMDPKEESKLYGVDFVATVKVADRQFKPLKDSEIPLKVLVESIDLSDLRTSVIIRYRCPETQESKCFSIRLWDNMTNVQPPEIIVQKDKIRTGYRSTNARD